MIKAVLGGGITSLIYLYYNKNFFSLTDQVGGQMSSSFDLGPRYLHNKSKYVTDFLQSLDIPIEHKTIKIGYLCDNGWVENPDLEFRQKYYMKSRGVKDISGFDYTVLNMNTKEFVVCNIDFKKLVEKLFDKVASRIYISPVIKIDLVEQLIFCDHMKVKYDNLVSTIPLNIFCKLSNLNQKLESISMTYCLMSQDFFDLENYDYVYDNRTTTNFHRMTKSKKGIVCDILESNKKDFLKTNKVIEHKTISNAQIISLDKDFKLKEHSEVRFIGRYGAWNRRWKTETIIEEVQKHE